MHCFVISPFGGDFDSVFDEILAPSLAGAGYEAIRADTSDGSVNILKDIVNGIGQADLIIADLTGLNANVMYELGLAHGLCKPVIILTQAIDSLPFDLKAYRAYPYTVHFSEAAKLAKHISDIAKRHKESLIEFGSPVSDFLSVAGPDALKRKQDQDELDLGEGAQGLLEKYLASNEAAHVMSRAFEDISYGMERLTSKIGPSADTLGAISVATMSDHLKVTESIREAKVISNELTSFANGLKENRQVVDRCWPIVEDYGEFVIGLLDVLELNDENIIDNTLTYLSLNAVSDRVSGSVIEFRDSVKGVGFISSDLDRATKEAVKAINPLISLLGVISASTHRFGEVLMRVAEERNLSDEIALRIAASVSQENLQAASVEDPNGAAENSATQKEEDSPTLNKRKVASRKRKNSEPGSE